MLRRLTAVERVLPSLVMAAGVTLLTAGVIAYAPATSGDGRTDGPGGDALFSPSPVASAGASAPTPTPIDIQPLPSTTDRPTPLARATRIRVPALDIDLPVVPGDLAVDGNEGTYPLCDVAMYLPELSQPGESGTTYIYAHAQRGMFLPLLRASTLEDGAELIGALVEVYTNADELHLYEIVEVRRHATDLSIVTEAGSLEQLVLQTSEGPAGTVPKLQVAARPVSIIRAPPGEARPSPEPRVCVPD